LKVELVLSESMSQGTDKFVVLILSGPNLVSETKAPKYKYVKSLFWANTVDIMDDTEAPLNP